MRRLQCNKASLLLFFSYFFLDASRESWLDILKSLNLKEVELRDCRYDLIVHMVLSFF